VIGRSLQTDYEDNRSDDDRSFPHRSSSRRRRAHPFERQAHFPSRSKTILSIFGETLLDDRPQSGRDAIGQRWRRATKSGTTGGFIKKDAKSPDV
jgi:hypothetical protein